MKLTRRFSSSLVPSQSPLSLKNAHTFPPTSIRNRHETRPRAHSVLSNDGFKK